MNVYITYDRYEHDEWFSVYHVETNKLRAIKHFKENDLPHFLDYGPDDCHSFQLQVVQMTKEEYHNFCDLIEHEGSSENNRDDELREMLINIYDECDWYSGNTIFFTDGCSDYIEMVRFYCIQNDLDADDDDVIDEVQEKLFNDEELLEDVMKEYINATYIYL